MPMFEGENGVPVQQVVDRVVENDGKIVVTTTISLDRSTLERRSGYQEPAMSAPAAMPGNPLSGLLPTQKAIQHGNISLMPMGKKLYLGLVDGRVRAHTLCIGDTLFVFVPKNNSLTGMVELISELVSQIPPNVSWSDSDTQIDLEQLSRILGMHSSQL